ncbi:cell division protein FtsQ/DivIB [Candidatus Omnitrophota bacterium]
MAKKKKKRARRSRPPVRRKRALPGVGILFKLIPIILVLALVGLGIKGITSLFLKSEYFQIKVVNVTAKHTGKLSSSIAMSLSSKKGLNIFKINLKDCESDIRYRHQDLKDIIVKRVLPDTLEVSYKVRTPFCQIDSGSFVLCSDDGVMLPDPKPVADPYLPIITGVKLSRNNLKPGRQPYSKSLKRAISLLKEIKESRLLKSNKVAKIDIYDEHNPLIILEDNTRIEIGEESFKDKEKVLESILNELKEKGRSAEVIDLRFDDVVVIPR